MGFLQHLKVVFYQDRDFVLKNNANFILYPVRNE